MTTIKNNKQNNIIIIIIIIIIIKALSVYINESMLNMSLNKVFFYIYKLLENVIK